MPTVAYEGLRPPEQLGDPAVLSRLGVRSPASISRYSRTLTPTNPPARQTRSPSRFRSCSIIAEYAAEVATLEAYAGRGTDLGDGG
jgi:hypothetical protein